MARQRRSGGLEYTGLTKGTPLIILWMGTNSALLAHKGEWELGVLRANFMGFMTDAEKGKLEKDLHSLNRYLEEQRARVAREALPTPRAMEWKNEYLRLLLKHADDADLFQTERIGSF